jgi:hypothetical protein
MGSDVLTAAFMRVLSSGTERRVVLQVNRRLAETYCFHLLGGTSRTKHQRGRQMTRRQFLYRKSFLSSNCAITDTLETALHTARWFLLRTILHDQS